MNIASRPHMQLVDYARTHTEHSTVDCILHQYRLEPLTTRYRTFLSAKIA